MNGDAEDMHNIAEELQAWLIEKFGNKYISPNGGFLFILVNECDGDGGLGVQFYANYRVKECPHCYSIVKKVFEGGLESIKDELRMN